MTESLHWLINVSAAVRAFFGSGASEPHRADSHDCNLSGDDSHVAGEFCNVCLTRLSTIFLSATEHTPYETPKSTRRDHSPAPAGSDRTPPALARSGRQPLLDVSSFD